MKKTYFSIFSILGMFIVVGVAYGLDIWMDNLKRIAMAEFRLSSWLLIATIMELFFAGLLLAWLWFIYFKDENRPIVAIIYILFGSALLIYNYLVITAILPLPMQSAIVPKSLFSFASAFIAMAGLQRLLFRNKEINQ